MSLLPLPVAPGALQHPVPEVTGAAPAPGLLQGGRVVDKTHFCLFACFGGLRNQTMPGDILTRYTFALHLHLFLTPHCSWVLCIIQIQQN